MQGRKAPPIIVLFGGPGSGKGTQSALLSSRYSIASMSTGVLLREEAKRDTPTGFRLRQTMAAGELVSDEIVCDAVAMRIRTLASDARLILDGFPRTVFQARSLDQLLESLGLPGPLVLHLEVPNDVLKHRLASRRQCATCGAIYNLVSSGQSKAERCRVDGGMLVEREDDTEGAIAHRLTTYDLQTQPVIDYYRAAKTASYRRIDGDRPPAEIANDVREMAGCAEAAVAA